MIDTEASRLDAIKALIADEIKREDKSVWREIFNDPSLAPHKTDPQFVSAVLKLLTKEMNEGYKRKDAYNREKRKIGKSAKYTPNQMYINANIGRYIFAEFGWHDLTKHRLKSKILTDLAEAFKFKIKPEENELQFLSREERRNYLSQKSDEEYKSRNNTMLIGGLGIIFSVVWYAIKRMG